MSVIQFKVLLIPTGQKPAGLTHLYDEDADDAPAETLIYKFSLKVIEAMVAERLPPRISWSPDYFLFGDDGGDELRLSVSASGSVELIEARISCAKNFRPFLRFACEMAERLGCQLLYMRRKQYLEPRYELLEPLIRDSWARMIAEDPATNLPLAARDAAADLP